MQLVHHPLGRFLAVPRVKGPIVSPRAHVVRQKPEARSPEAQNSVLHVCCMLRDAFYQSFGLRSRPPLWSRLLGVFFFAPLFLQHTLAAAIYGMSLMRGARTLCSAMARREAIQRSSPSRLTSRPAQDHHFAFCMTELQRCNARWLSLDQVQGERSRCMY